ncbi:histidinol phosphatase [Chitinophaga polysaccharea]|uniref:tyrosine-protein phosphatase n=1 Tax=Chitinophaga TaxID=79328 RepID=UPI001455D6A1|nr:MULTISPECIES: CpsB/CapC family capsule biosynthesis tyrosine phosphatase [Chitinophaga]NLR58973.1 histidinol phosphatase [Chitinophaga polysaccharea]NLU92242.1 histidinol phosphatase [Chitinophaga sp. Ak27]
MLFFRKRNTDQAVPAQLLAFMGTDIHSHLIPGIDDGVPDVATAMAFIEQLQHMGIQKIVTTPHIMMDRYPNSAATIAAPYQEVVEALARKNNTIPFHYAAEYYMDEQFETLLQQPLLTLSGNKVLVEISFISPPLQLAQWLFDIQAAGYQPVLAHPERYAYYHADIVKYEQLKKQGCLLQLNLLSLTGYYGKHVQQAAEKLMAAGLPDLIGTDLHHEKHLQAITGIAKNNKLRKLLDTYPFGNATL